MGRTWICLILATCLINTRGAPLNLPGNQLRSVTTSRSGNQMVVQLNTDGDFRYEKYELDNPKRLVIDLIRLKNAVRPSIIPVNSDNLRQISITQFRAQNPPITRVTMTLAAATPEYTVGRQGNQVRVVINAPSTKTSAAIPASITPRSPQNLSLSSPTAGSPQVRQISTSPNAVPETQKPQSKLPALSATAAAPSVSNQTPAPANNVSTAPLPAPATASSGTAPSSPEYFSTRTMQPNPRQIRVKPYLERPFGSPVPENAKPAAEESKAEKPAEPSTAAAREEAVKPESQPQAAAPPVTVAILPPPETPKEQPATPLKAEAVDKEPKAKEIAVPISPTGIPAVGNEPAKAGDLLAAESKALKAELKPSGTEAPVPIPANAETFAKPTPTTDKAKEAEAVDSKALKADLKPSGTEAPVAIPANVETSAKPTPTGGKAEEPSANESKALKVEPQPAPAAEIAVPVSPTVVAATAPKGNEIASVPAPAPKATGERTSRKESKISISSKARNSTIPQVVPVRILARKDTPATAETPNAVQKAASEPAKDISQLPVKEIKSEETLLKKDEGRIESGNAPIKPSLAVAEQPPVTEAVVPAPPPSKPVEPEKVTSAIQAMPVPAVAPPVNPPVANVQTAQPNTVSAETAAAAQVSEPVPVVMSPEAALKATLGPSGAATVRQTASAKPNPASSPASKLPASRLGSAGNTPRRPSAALEPNTLPQQLTPVRPQKASNGLPSSASPTQAVKLGLAAEAASQTTPTQYTGEPIDFNVKDLDLVDFFRMMAQVSGLNISVDPDVGGRITMTMGAVPWDQIFDLALLTHRLEKKVEGNVVRVARKETLQSEEAAKKSLKQAVEDATDTQFMAMKLNYADAKLLAGSLTDQLSARGKVLFDERTNTLIVSDVPKKLAELTDLIKQLDISEPQVLIESRIVQATRNFAKEIGVNFGFVTGNSQRITVGAPPLVGTQIPGLLNSNVGLSATRSFGKLGIRVGNIVDTLMLDAAISAGEQKGVAKLLSEPKVYAQNNREAVIRQGVRFPIQVVQNNTVSILFQDAALSLRATPKITDEDTILLTLKVENNVADFTRSVNGIPSIKTSESETKVLIPNGGTTVIGGILVDEDRTTDDRVPGLASVPVFGHLFKRRNSEKRTEEVLFFITPKIER